MPDRERYYWLKSKCRCVSCKRQDAYTLAGRTYCYECNELKKKALRTPQAVQKQKERYAKIYKERVDKHLCTKCGAYLEPEYSYKLCPKCRCKARIHQRIRYAQRDDSFQRGEYGMCYLCNKQPVIEGKKLCQKCYDITLKNQKLASEAAKALGRERPFARLRNLDFMTKQVI